MSKRMVDLKVADGKIASINGFELGGSGGSGGNGGEFIVTNITSTTVSPSSQYNLGWVSGRELKANTAYAVGDQLQIAYKKASGFYQITKNEIVIPVIAHDQVPYSTQKLQFGDVILVCTNADYSINTKKTTNEFYFSVNSCLTYTVVKAGTTGSDVTIPSSISGDIKLDINFYTLGPATA